MSIRKSEDKAITVGPISLSKPNGTLPDDTLTDVATSPVIAWHYENKPLDTHTLRT
jgi:hypothetical protein